MATGHRHFPGLRHAIDQPVRESPPTSGVLDLVAVEPRRLHLFEEQHHMERAACPRYERLSARQLPYLIIVHGCLRQQRGYLDGILC
jgi:hypothetical protein